MFSVMMIGLWKMAWAWVPVLVVGLVGGYYELKKK